MALLKFYTDEHISKAIIKGLRNHGIDVLTCQEAGLMSALDTKHLSFAHQHGRIIVTMDTDFIKLHDSRITHSGIIFITPQKTIGQIIQKIRLIYFTLDAEHMSNHMEFI